MHKKNCEVYHSGWLVKSPPNPRGSIFKARWRRRWFTLLQGELPGQYFLEYYTDSTCRRRKGIIDLDQVEQVDAGLSLDRASIKFQWMFDMKTPSRTYYLAADTERDMRDWVMVICQVCNLQETDEKNTANESISPSTTQYNDFLVREIPNDSTNTETSSNSKELVSQMGQLSLCNDKDYENGDFLNKFQSDNNNHQSPTTYINLSENTLSSGKIIKQSISNSTLSSTSTVISHPTTKSTGAIKKIPDKIDLKRDDKINNNLIKEHSTSYSSSGPYIPLSDCFSGSPVLFKNESDPKTPLNSLDPKFYDNPRSHITNIGLNLTDDQPNSPKRTNIQQQQTPTLQKHGKQCLNSSPTDSEGGSTDEEWSEPKTNEARKTRPSDSSMENETIITAGQSYMRMSIQNPIPLPPKRISLVLDKKQESSDTEENASPIGPKDRSAFVNEESYDVPRCYFRPPLSGSHRDIDTMTPLSTGHIMTSTPNLIHSGMLEKNFYSNAPPREPNVFRFDVESIAMPPPEVNRTLKPKKNGFGVINNAQAAPIVDRKLKPTTLPKPQVIVGTNSLKRRGPETISLSEVDDSLLNESIASNHSFGLSPKTPDRLQYLDLDHTNSPQKNPFGSIASNMTSLDISFNGSIKGEGPTYTTVDFVKTDAFNRVREDSEMTRASKSRMKN
ncbi:hypothetical protein PVAND_006903 [Polypedilum vanderplanki]|uniref:PH domain-containing protein n=1 Tax=Polypedilum vanderplanki TaxID=319348 RepID=A0A9J6C5K0_POLVA|nr:hypothetical protein PVAND_006903 [Polypedilum vanderplanki]